MKYPSYAEPQRIHIRLRSKASQKELAEWSETVFRALLPCSDGGCVFGHPGGMHTNGGCQHLKGDRLTTVLRLRHLAKEMGVDISDLDEASHA